MNNTTMIGGGIAALLALLVWIIAPYPANLILISILTIVSIITYFTLDRFFPNHRLHEVVPASILDVIILAFLVATLLMLDTASAWMIWFGVLFITTGYILGFRHPVSRLRQTWGKAHYVIGGVLIAGGIFWAIAWGILEYTNYNDNVIRWFENSTSQVIQEENDWYLVLTTDGKPVRYLATVEYLTRSKMEFAAVWIDNNEYGETVANLEQSGYRNRYSRYSGEVTIRPAGSIPLQYGTAQLEEVNDECFVGNIEFSSTKYEAKLHRKGVRCG